MRLDHLLSQVAVVVLDGGEQLLGLPALRWAGGGWGGAWKEVGGEEVGWMWWCV